MKNSLACPKCESRKLWRIEKFDAGGEGGNGDTMRVAQFRGTSEWGRGGQTTGWFDAYVCAQCGYSEFWAHTFGDLKPDAGNGIHFIDTTPQQGQYR